MNGGSLRSEAVRAMRTVLTSAESLQLTLKPELSQEEQALKKPSERLPTGYCSKTTHRTRSTRVLRVSPDQDTFPFSFDFSCCQ